MLSSKILKNAFCFATFLFLSVVQQAHSKTSEEVFSGIYQNKTWGQDSNGQGTSGTGSKLETTVKYRELIQNLLKQLHIKSVVDIGCGDWVISSAINWDGIQYYGYDVVHSVINANQSKYQSDNIHFIFGDAAHIDLPNADLLICKDVLQHLPYADIDSFISKLPQFKYCLITNDIDPNNLTVNQDCEKGGWRPIDLTKPPFLVKGKPILTYQAIDTTKQVILIINH